MISVKNITKTYSAGKANIKALNDVSLEISKGELFGVVGPDGSGKTSLFRILATLVLADSGSASIEGFDCAENLTEIRNIIGYMPGKFSLYQDLSVEENLNFFADIYGTSIAENYEIIKDIYVQIEPFKTRRAGKLSGGMKQKLALCCALVHKPKVLFLDEPTTGVDPVSRQEFWAILRTLNADGMTIMVSTPYMDEASLCGRIALMQNGKILTEGTPQDIVGKHSSKVFEIRSSNDYALLETLRTKPEIRSVYMFGDCLHVVFNNDKIPEYLPQNINIQEINAGIEDCFISFIKN